MPAPQPAARFTILSVTTDWAAVGAEGDAETSTVYEVRLEDGQIVNRTMDELAEVLGLTQDEFRHQRDAELERRQRERAAERERQQHLRLQAATVRRQMAEYRAAMDEQQRTWAEKQRQVEDAETRAKKLLVSLLDEKQRESYDKHRYFTVTTPAGNTYQIARGYSGNVVLLDDEGGNVASFCAYPRRELRDGGYLPEHDCMVGQLLLLMTDEAEFIRTGFVGTFGGPKKDGLDKYNQLAVAAFKAGLTVAVSRKVPSTYYRDEMQYRSTFANHTPVFIDGFHGGYRHRERERIVAGDRGRAAARLVIPKPEVDATAIAAAGEAVANIGEAMVRALTVADLVVNRAQLVDDRAW